ncbi:MAG: lipoyl(octanoyl) transferase LipB [Myxococcales bacterium]|nr:lipoyl(octanoyl) transferase LipB [Myxococcales bacterium]MCB9644314.1 lipoyl(octanoyl) transferase LipB [Myxococcales bacterium]
MEHPKDILQWTTPGLVPYQEAWAWQKELRQQRIQQQIPDTLLLLEHPPTITLGRLRGEQSLLLSPQLLEQKGVELIRSDRGGDATLHAPGQLVGYLIVNLKDRKLSLYPFVEKIAGAIISYLQGFDLDARYDEKYPGIWIKDQKITAFGLHIHRDVTMHGFALNLQTDLDLFQLLVPCGLVGKGVASLHQTFPQAPSPQEAAAPIALAIAEALHLEPRRFER